MNQQEKDRLAENNVKLQLKLLNDLLEDSNLMNMQLNYELHTINKILEANCNGTTSESTTTFQINLSEKDWSESMLRLAHITSNRLSHLKNDLLNTYLENIKKNKEILKIIN